MVLLNVGLNDIRDQIDSLINNGQLGTDGTEAKTSDTSIGSAITGTSKSITTTTFDLGLKLNYVTSAGDGSGNSAREFYVDDTSSNGLIRSVFPEIDITGTTVVEIDTQILLIQEL